MFASNAYILLVNIVCIFNIIVTSLQILGSPTSLSMKKRDQENNHLVVCFGELLIDFVPTVSEVSLAEAPGFKKAPGGAPANVAVGIARLGGSSAFIGKVLYIIVT